MKYIKRFELYNNDNTKFDVSGCELTSLDKYLPFSNNLESLNCRANNLQKLPKLPTKLIYLYCDENMLEELTELPENLEVLNISNNSHINIISKLPKKLSTLSCCDCNFKELPELPKTLKYLYCQHNSLIELPKLPNTLTYFNCSYNKLKVLPTLPDTLTLFKCTNNDWEKPIKYEYMMKFNLGIYEIYTLEKIKIFSSFKFQKEFLEIEPENFMDLKLFKYADGIEELFPHLFDMDDLGLLD